MKENVFTDANYLYNNFSSAEKSSGFKYETQLFEMNQLLETAKLQKRCKEKKYKPQFGKNFILNERGKVRYITANKMPDKAINHLLCDEIITKNVKKYLIYDNGASQKGKGVSFQRKRLEIHLHKYFNEYKTNEGYILLIDFSGYYANIIHSISKEQLIEKGLSNLDPNSDLYKFMVFLIDQIYQSFELDVSFLSDDEIDKLYNEKVDPKKYKRRNNTSKKLLKKGVDIGNQLSQTIGILFPYKIDNYVKIVKHQKYYGRYTDDSYIISNSKKELQDILLETEKIAKEYHIIINKKKTRITKISSSFTFLKIKYFLTSSGKVVKRIANCNITRERKKLKSYKKLLDKGTLDYETIENSFKS